MNKETTIAIPADPNDPDDFPVSVAGVERGLMGRRIRRLRNRLGLSQEAFGERYGIPVANIRQYEIGRHMPPPAVRAYPKIINAEPEIARGRWRLESASTSSCHKSIGLLPNISDSSACSVQFSVPARASRGVLSVMIRRQELRC